MARHAINRTLAISLSMQVSNHSNGSLDWWACCFRLFYAKFSKTGTRRSPSTSWRKETRMTSRKEEEGLDNAPKTTASAHMKKRRVAESLINILSILNKSSRRTFSCNRRRGRKWEDFHPWTRGYWKRTRSFSFLPPLLSVSCVECESGSNERKLFTKINEGQDSEESHAETWQSTDDN